MERKLYAIIYIKLDKKAVHIIKTLILPVENKKED